MTPPLPRDPGGVEGTSGGLSWPQPPTPPPMNSWLMLPPTGEWREGGEGPASLGARGQLALLCKAC